MMVVYNYGYNSLGMYNPAVTLAQIIRNSKNFHRVDRIQWIMYFSVQFLGGIAGGFFATIIGGKDACMVHTYVNPAAEAYEAFFAEFFFCTILVSLNIHLATDKRVDGNQFYGLSIGTSLFVSVLCIGDITGSAINPAVWVGTVTSAAFCAEEDNELKLERAWIYWVAHFLAGTFYGVWFRLIYSCEDAYGDDDPNVIKKYAFSSTPDKKQNAMDAPKSNHVADDDSTNIIYNVDADDNAAGGNTELTQMDARK